MAELSGREDPFPDEDLSELDRLAPAAVVLEERPGMVRGGPVAESSFDDAFEEQIVPAFEW